MDQSKINIPNVTLCCVDTRAPYDAIKALDKCTENCSFTRSVLLTDQHCTEKYEEIIIPKINNMTHYSKFMIKDLLNYLKLLTSHILIIQHDGYIINGELWTNKFLQYDYIGAVWPAGIPGASASEPTVGNGGFSLRSVKLLNALQDTTINSKLHPEDISICITYRDLLKEKYDINIAPLEIARIFSVENEILEQKTFGAHSINTLKTLNKL